MFPHGDDTRIRFSQDNPKRPGSSAYERYERYKGVLTVSAAREYGATSADFKSDFEHQYLQVLPQLPAGLHESGRPKKCGKKAPGRPTAAAGAVARQRKNKAKAAAKAAAKAPGAAPAPPKRKQLWPAGAARQKGGRLGRAVRRLGAAEAPGRPAIAAVPPSKRWKSGSLHVPQEKAANGADVFSFGPRRKNIITHGEVFQDWVPPPPGSVAAEGIDANGSPVLDKSGLLMRTSVAGACTLYAGISWNCRREGWVVRIRKTSGKQVFLGFFKKELDAAKMFTDVYFGRRPAMAPLDQLTQTEAAVADKKEPEEPVVKLDPKVKLTKGLRSGATPHVADAPSSSSSSRTKKKAAQGSNESPGERRELVKELQRNLDVMSAAQLEVYTDRMQQNSSEGDTERADLRLMATPRLQELQRFATSLLDNASVGSRTPARTRKAPQTPLEEKPAKRTSLEAAPIEAAQEAAPTKKVAQEVAQEAVPTKKAAQEAVPPKKAAQEAVPAKKVAQEAVPAKKAAKEAVPKVAEEEVPTKRVAQEAVPTEKVAKKAVPTEKVAQEAVPTKKIAKEAVPTKKVAEEAVPTKKVAQEAVPTETVAKEALPTKAAVRPSLCARPSQAAPTPSRKPVPSAGTAPAQGRQPSPSAEPARSRSPRPSAEPACSRSPRPSVEAAATAPALGRQPARMPAGEMRPPLAPSLPREARVPSRAERREARVQTHAERREARVQTRAERREARVQTRGRQARAPSRARQARAPSRAREARTPSCAPSCTPRHAPSLAGSRTPFLADERPELRGEAIAANEDEQEVFRRQMRCFLEHKQMQEVNSHQRELHIAAAIPPPVAELPPLDVAGTQAPAGWHSANRSPSPPPPASPQLAGVEPPGQTAVVAPPEEPPLGGLEDPFQPVSDGLPWLGDDGGWEPGREPDDAWEVPRISLGDTEAPGPCREDCTCSQVMHRASDLEKPWPRDARRSQALAQASRLAAALGIARAAGTPALR